MATLENYFSKQKELDALLEDTSFREEMMQQNDRTTLQNKYNIARNYFTDTGLLKKILSKDKELVQQMPTAYRTFQADVTTFQDFYRQRFKKEAASIDSLTQQELYGVLVVAAKDRAQQEDLEKFLDKGIKGKNLKVTGVPKGSRSPGMGVWKHD